MFAIDLISKTVRAFKRAEGGNVGIIFALSVVPIMGLAGAAIDYTNATRTRQQVQEALDVGAIAGAKAVGRPNAEITDIATRFTQANLPTSLQSTPISVDILNNGTTVRVRPTAPVRINTAMLPIIGINSIDVSATSEATNGYTDLEIVLALDNTGSMSGTKISVLRTAVTNFINSMEALANGSGRSNSVRIGIVPFDRMVNMGTSFRTQPWIDFSGWGGSPSTWNGCVTDREQSRDVTDLAPTSGDTTTWFRAVSCSLEPVAQLTSDWTALRGTASRMRASGNTNVTIGLVHGWHMLTSAEPYTGAQAPRERLTKVLIMLTDGENTQNRWTTSESAIDARTRLVCTNIKAAGIHLYTIRVINGDQTLLRECATNPAMYYNVTAAEQMNTVFQSLASQMSALRLSR